MPTPFHLRRERERRGLTQAQLADAADVRQAAISQYETGKVEPTWSALCRIADALRVPLDRFRRPDPA